jgi:hypothetical protein
VLISGLDADDNFGFAVDIDGDTLVVGAPGDDDGGTDVGAVYVLTRDGSGTWSVEDKLVPTGAAVADAFGHSVAIAGDDVVVGVPFDDTNGFAAGAAYVFSRSGTTWTQETKLLPAEVEEGDIFGESVAVHEDGGIVVGATGDDDEANNAGAAYVFTRNPTTLAWEQQAKLTASDADIGDNFGQSVSIDGDTLVVGADGDSENGLFTGAAYVFTRSGTTWTEDQKLLASDGTAGDVFGRSVAVDGDTIVVGAENTNPSSTPFLGAVYVFTRDGGGTWSELGTLFPDPAGSTVGLGNAVDVDGSSVVAGARDSDGAGFATGTAFIFELP